MPLKDSEIRGSIHTHAYHVTVVLATLIPKPLFINFKLRSFATSYFYTSHAIMLATVYIAKFELTRQFPRDPILNRTEYKREIQGEIQGVQ